MHSYPVFLIFVYIMYNYNVLQYITYIIYIAPVPYASSMEQAVVKRGTDVITTVYQLLGKN